MSFIESRLLECVAYGFQGGPTFATQIVQLRTGVERREAMRSRPLYRFVAPYQNLDPSDHEAVIDVFNACLGAAYGFRFKDWADYQATAEALGTAPSGSTPVQLIKTYTRSSLSTVRTIKKPVAGSVTVYRNGTPFAGTLDTTTGIFTPGSAWSGGTLTWTGDFDVPVRFASDDLIFSYANYRALTADVSLVEDLSA